MQLSVPVLPASASPLEQAKKFLPLRAMEALGITLAAVLVAMVLFGLFVALWGYNPLTVYATMWKGSFGTWFNAQRSLTQAAPLLLTGLCVALPLRLGMVIIGGEGAFLLGALAAAVAGHQLAGSSPIVSVLGMTLAGGVVGGAWIALSGGLRQFRGVNETISSLLLNYVALNILLHLVYGPLKDPLEPRDPSTHPIGANVKPFLAEFLGWRVHWGFGIGIAACVALYFLMHHTVVGFASSIVGGNVRAARVAGLSISKLTILICFLGGACAGIAGMLEMATGSGKANEKLAVGYGYEGILVAFLARGNPLAIIPVAIFLGGIKSGGYLLQTNPDLKLPNAAIMVLQGFIFLTVLGAETFYGRFGFFKRKEA
ncbi:MAG: ABC transporter permease [Phycisphaerae bacterium]